MRNRSRTVAVVLVLLASAGLARAEEPARGYQAKVKVAGPTRLDWTFVLAKVSQAETPAGWLPDDYDSAKQQYELFIPPNYNPKQPCPVVLFVNPGKEAGGWKQWEPVCKQAGAIFIAPFDAGNDCPVKKRVRIVLDVLDDVRRNYATDPDRTYITGFSGGGRIAAAVAFALPDCFGGVAPLCAAGDLRDEGWLRHRLVDRLSVALVTGENDFNRGEVERFRGPQLADLGVRSKVWVTPKMGHAVPSTATLREVFQWFDDGAAKRREFAKKYPASRTAGDAAPTREELAKALLAEGKQRIEGAETLYSGLLILNGVQFRFADLSMADEARKLLAESRTKRDQWKEASDADERRLLAAEARGLASYATGPLPPEYAKQRGPMAAKALELWEEIVKDGKDAKAVEEAKTRIPELKKLAKKE
jgi:predicted esterase